MGKGKLAKFEEMQGFSNVLQYPYAVLQEKGFPLRGKWSEEFFGNDHPIVLELGCGRGEYTVGLARKFPNVNFIGIDIKGARMWSGAKQTIQEGLSNVAFLRTNIEFIDRFFAPQEVSEIWLTFSDPQMKHPRKRLTGTAFITRYQRILKDLGIIHLKTDSQFLFTYTRLMAQKNEFPDLLFIPDLHGYDIRDEDLAELMDIHTYYETMWMERDIPIKYIRFALPKDATPMEPEEEIPFDEYRSYNRHRRSESAQGK